MIEEIAKEIVEKMSYIMATNILMDRLEIKELLINKDSVDPEDKMHSGSIIALNPEIGTLILRFHNDKEKKIMDKKAHKFINEK